MGPILAFAQAQHLARVTFWSVNRDRPCGAAAARRMQRHRPGALAFGEVLAAYHG